MNQDTVKIYIYNRAKTQCMAEDDKRNEDNWRQTFPQFPILCEEEHALRQANDDKERQKAQEQTQAYREHFEALNAHYDVLGASGVAGDF